MYRNGQNRDDAHALQTVDMCGGVCSPHLLDAVELMRVFGIGDEFVDDACQQHAAKESRSGNDMSFGRTAGQFAQRETGFVEQFHERDIDHYTGGEAKSKGEEARIGLAGEEGDCTADAGGASGEQAE